MNGKGSAIRKGANLKAYWDNYDEIFRKDAPVPEEEEPSTNSDNSDTNTSPDTP